VETPERWQFNLSEKKKTMLVIEDDRSILRVFARVLEKKGYAVVGVENGKDAMEQIKNRCFDAALIDLNLPDMQGTELLTEIQEKSPKTVKIIFTGSPTGEFSENRENENMDAFLVKPVKPEVLLSILDEKLKNNAPAC
jgi:DNA-binding NtrC family response regulator